MKTPASDPPRPAPADAMQEWNGSVERQLAAPLMRRAVDTTSRKALEIVRDTDAH